MSQHSQYRCSNIWKEQESFTSNISLGNIFCTLYNSNSHLRTIKHQDINNLLLASVTIQRKQLPISSWSYSTCILHKHIFICSCASCPMLWQKNFCLSSKRRVWFSPTFPGSLCQRGKGLVTFSSINFPVKEAYVNFDPKEKGKRGYKWIMHWSYCEKYWLQFFSRSCLCDFPIPSPVLLTMYPALQNLDSSLTSACSLISNSGKPSGPVFELWSDLGLLSDCWLW